ncbi:MAG: bifunctional oligoribonuclease/PAP phosphatase NrnA [Acidobacteria bacterium]|nr:bifunctional oligoribonuclease/PAP phosphatase NrnA [Acidobacteriota bacterium]
MKGSAADVAAALRARRSFVVTSHARPDGDAVGSSVALALALEALGKTVTVVLKDPVPLPYRGFPAVDRIQQTAEVGAPADAAVVLECSDISRPEIQGLDRYFVVNVDHHLGNRQYGAVNWFDASAAACGEMVAEIIDALGVTWSRAIAEHLYLAITTDTGGFRYGSLSPRTFEICRRIAATGVDVAELSRRIFDSFSIGRVKLTGALLAGMELHHGDRLAILAFDDDMLARCGAALDDTEGLVNLPLSAREVSAVALFKRQQADGVYRVSLRSKGAVDVRVVAERWEGGGHRNAAGCTMRGVYPSLRDEIVAALSAAIDAADRSSAGVVPASR